MDDETRRVALALGDYFDEVVQAARAHKAATGEQIADRLTAHLGADAATLPVLDHRVANHQLVNLDVAMEVLVAGHGGGEVIGVGGGDQRHHASFGDVVQQSLMWRHFPVGAVDRIDVPTGPTTQRQAVAYGIHLFRYDGTPVAVLQTLGRPQYGRGDSAVEVLAPDGVAERLIADLRRLSIEHNVFRGQVLTLGSGDDAYNPTVGGVTFHPRPHLTAADVVLPDALLDRVERHVVGTAVHRDALRAAGQHLKRGLLLYGPPGTGKTHTVRFLLGRLTGVTVVLLSGSSLRFVGEATELARALQPAVVVLEDVDLVALDRSLHEGPQPLLFTVMEAMDGLEGDSDVGFVLTTNRADLLEPALAQRPGRVDLAVEIPLPDLPQRRRLAALYSRSFGGFTDAALDTVATRTAGATASLFKELIRRAVLVGAEHGREATDADLVEALAELLDEREHLTRSLLGSGGPGR